jgi:hypothetical protein
MTLTVCTRAAFLPSTAPDISLSTRNPLSGG